MGIKTRQGFGFKYNSIQRIINNDAYKGTLVSNKTIGQYMPRPKEEWGIVHNAHEPIVDEATWKTANKIVN
ncbi:recombinase family protein [Bacillus aerius]|uniref:recombinase family protein n=1 Tax=Bacillus aerius TaxID=293388 RepID=UPI002815F434|nr:recombinase family protein [Bacillus aerius]WMT28760.1 recombinase family protein [Bacillus aerius]